MAKIPVVPLEAWALVQLSGAVQSFAAAKSLREDDKPPDPQVGVAVDVVVVSDPADALPAKLSGQAADDRRGARSGSSAACSYPLLFSTLLTLVLTFDDLLILVELVHR